MRAGWSACAAPSRPGRAVYGAARRAASLLKLESGLRHAPKQGVDAVLTKERFAVKHHQRHAPMTRRILIGFVFEDLGVNLVGLGVRFRIQPSGSSPAL